MCHTRCECGSGSPWEELTHVVGAVGGGHAAPDHSGTDGCNVRCKTRGRIGGMGRRRCWTRRRRHALEAFKRLTGSPAARQRKKEARRIALTALRSVSYTLLCDRSSFHSNCDKKGLVVVALPAALRELADAPCTQVAHRAVACTRPACCRMRTSTTTTRYQVLCCAAAQILRACVDWHAAGCTRGRPETATKDSLLPTR